MINEMKLRLTAVSLSFDYPNAQSTGIAIAARDGR